MAVMRYEYEQVFFTTRGTPIMRGPHFSQIMTEQLNFIRPKSDTLSDRRIITDKDVEKLCVWTFATFKKLPYQNHLTTILLETHRTFGNTWGDARLEAIVSKLPYAVFMTYEQFQQIFWMLFNTASPRGMGNVASRTLLDKEWYAFLASCLKNESLDPASYVDKETLAATCKNMPIFQSRQEEAEYIIMHLP